MNKKNHSTQKSQTLWLQGFELTTSPLQILSSTTKPHTQLYLYWILVSHILY